MREKRHKKWNQESKQKQSHMPSFCNIFDLLTSRTQKIASCPPVLKPNFSYSLYWKLRKIKFHSQIFIVSYLSNTYYNICVIHICNTYYNTRVYSFVNLWPKQAANIKVYIIIQRNVHNLFIFLWTIHNKIEWCCSVLMSRQLQYWMISHQRKWFLPN